MDCFPDFCLGCDSQAVDGLYCSEACRMNDLERSGSTSSTPTAQSHAHHYHFGQLTSSCSKVSSNTPSTLQTSNTGRTLSTSSSHSSLHSHSSTSSISVQTSNDISTDDARALQGFFNAFDRTRYDKRRPAPAVYSQWATLIKTDN